MESYDLIVVGGGFAGTAAAIAAARKGLRVLLIEKATALAVPLFKALSTRSWDTGRLIRTQKSACI